YREPESSYLLSKDFSFAHSLKEWQKIWDKEWYSAIEKDIHFARYLIGNQNYDEAIELLNKRIKSKKSKAELFELRGRAHLYAGNFLLALRDFENAYHRSKRNYVYLALQANALFNLNQNGKALTQIEQAIEKSGGKPDYLLLKAKILSKLNRYSEAYETLKKYLVYFPNNTEANLNLARYAYESGYYTDALLAIAKMLKFTPDNIELILLRGKIYLKTDQPRQAIVDFEKAISQNYCTAESYLLKGLALLQVGERQEACKCFSISGSLGNIDAQGLHFNTCRK
ncbi:MAG: tetratricopeptide repeat protein, partial [Bacteroidales bacterium]|nr:tetratricopeptide repeat protein [Bacteroidales bacterium]